MTNSSIALDRLAEPFAPEDIEWRISRSGRNTNGVFALVLAYITARAIQKRLDDVCGPANWRNEEPITIDIHGKTAMVGGISIRINGEWITKWDVAEPTNIEPAKGGFSGAMKRAGAQWGIGRYLYYLDETFAEVSDARPAGSRQWQYGKLPQKQGGGGFYWKSPGLPAWAMPKEPEHEVSVAELNNLKLAWQSKFAAGCKDPKELREGFSRFVVAVVGHFPVSDHTCWTVAALEECVARIAATEDPHGVSSDVPFDVEETS